MRRIRRVCLIALAAVAAVIVVVSVAWAIDSAMAGGQVARNTTVAGRPVGGLSRAQLTKLVAAVADDYRTSPVVVDAPGGGFTTNALDLGLSLDAAATERAATRTGRTGSVPGRIASWARGFLHPRAV